MTQVLDQVRSLYEAMPYPPPPKDLTLFKDGRLIPEGSPASFFHLYWPRETYRDDLDVLVAGCGTAQAVTLALRQPGLRVTGIDISQASLDHSAALAERYEVRNLTLERLPIERVADLRGPFDLIISTGVLHHLDDPAAGLRSLRRMLRPDGAMLLMVYASYGRAGVYMMQEYARLLSVEAEPSQIAAFRQTLAQCPNYHPFSIFASRIEDLQTDAGLADLLLHPRDRAFSVPQVYDWLSDCGLRFCRWFHQAPYLPHCSPLMRMPHGKRLLSLPEPQQHAAMELFRGAINKHTFIACRDDRPPNTFAISFGDDWPSYVPLRFPGVTVAQDQLPQGVVAVLRNNAHAFADIAVGLDSAAARMYQPLDGQRTLGQIAACVKLSAPLERREAMVRSFYETLWRNDQVFFRVKA